MKSSNSTDITPIRAAFSIFFRVAKLQNMNVSMTGKKKKDEKEKENKRKKERDSLCITPKDLISLSLAVNIFSNDHRSYNWPLRRDLSPRAFPYRVL